MLNELLHRVRNLVIHTTDEMKDFDTWERLSKERDRLLIELDLFICMKEAELELAEETMDELELLEGFDPKVKGEAACLSIAS